MTSPLPDKSEFSFVIVNVAATLGTLAILYRSHIPGGSDYTGIGLLMWMVAAPAWIWVMLKTGGMKKTDSTQAKLRKRRILIVPIMMGLSVLPVTQLPQFICFSLFRTHLDHEAKEASASKPKRDLQWNPRRHTGPFPIYDVTVDDKGGIWIVTTVRLDGFGPGIVVDGFVYNPSREKTPYGRKYYDKTGPLHMKDYWYVFQASDDY